MLVRSTVQAVPYMIKTLYYWLASLNDITGSCYLSIKKDNEILSHVVKVAVSFWPFSPKVSLDGHLLFLFGSLYSWVILLNISFRDVNVILAFLIDFVLLCPYLCSTTITMKLCSLFSLHWQVYVGCFMTSCILSVQTYIVSVSQKVITIHFVNSVLYFFTLPGLLGCKCISFNGILIHRLE